MDKVMTKYLSLDVHFENMEQISNIEKKHNVKMVNVTQYHINYCTNRGYDYCGPDVYLVIGNESNIKSYLREDYFRSI